MRGAWAGAILAVGSRVGGTGVSADPPPLPPLEVDPLLEHLRTVEDMGLTKKLGDFIGIRPDYLHLLVDLIKARWSDVLQCSPSTTTSYYYLTSDHHPNNNYYCYHSSDQLAN